MHSSLWDEQEEEAVMQERLRGRHGPYTSLPPVQARDLRLIEGPGAEATEVNAVLVRDRCVLLNLMTVKAALLPGRLFLLPEAGADEDLLPLLKRLQAWRKALVEQREGKKEEGEGEGATGQEQQRGRGEEDSRGGSLAAGTGEPAGQQMPTDDGCSTNITAAAAAATAAPTAGEGAGGQAGGGATTPALLEGRSSAAAASTCSQPAAAAVAAVPDTPPHSQALHRSEEIDAETFELFCLEAILLSVCEALKSRMTVLQPRVSAASRDIQKASSKRGQEGMHKAP